MILATQHHAEDSLATAPAARLSSPPSVTPMKKKFIIEGGVVPKVSTGTAKDFRRV
jgi:hypothetical protein